MQQNSKVCEAKNEKLNGEIDKSIIIIMGGFNFPLSTVDRTIRQKISKAIVELNITNEQDLTDIYRILFSTTAIYKLFSSTHGT